MKTDFSDERQRAEQKLAQEVTADFEARRAERMKLERKWQLNINFIGGNQYCGINAAGDIEEEEKSYGWQPRRVFNRIAPTVELRCAKLARIRPALSVRAASEEECDRAAAALSAAVLASAAESCDLEGALSKATNWSESCGTAFYKVVWNNSGGAVIGGTEQGDRLFEGCVQVEAVSPFEIYPYSLEEESVEAQPSIVQARALPVQDVAAAYGVELAGDDLEGAGSPQPAVRKGYVTVIERYCRPTAELPEGRFSVVAGGRVLFDGALPYKNGREGERGYPFIKQVCMPLAGSFFGASVVERMIPVQRAYNAVRNRKHEFLNRISMGTVAVEEGSVDADDLAEDGLRPGKVIVYRQGGKPPEMLTLGTLPECFEREEETLRDEFAAISGTGDITQNGDAFSSVTSATGLQLLVEQDDARLNVCYDSIKQALKSVGRHILRLYRQFALGARLVKAEGGMRCYCGADITCDDVVLESDSDINLTPAERRNVVYELIDKGLLSDEDGNMSRAVKNEVLAFIGYGSFACGRDIKGMHAARAARENAEFAGGVPEVNDYDDHEVHIQEHTAYLLSGRCPKEAEKNVCEHIKIHRQKSKEDANG